jgi:hypothetical protein
MLQQPPTHTMSGTVRDGNGQPVSGVSVRLQLLSNLNIAVVSPPSDAAGHYAVTANAGVYILSNLSGSASAPLGQIQINSAFPAAQMPQYDLTTGDVTRDLQLVTSTLTVTVKDSPSSVS